MRAGKVDCIADIVGQKGFKRLWVACALVVMPEQHGRVAVNIHHAGALNAQGALAFLQPSAIAQCSQHKAQVNMGLLKRILKKRSIKGTSKREPL